MTYRQLMEKLPGLSDEQLDCDLTVCNARDDECFGECCLSFADEDVATSLDEDHPIIYFVP